MNAMQEGIIKSSYFHFAVSAAGGVAFNYDESGNMTYRGSHDQELVWDAENRLTEVKNFTSGQTLASFVYDGFDDRVFKTEDGSTTLYVNPYYEIQNYDIAQEQVAPHYYLGGRKDPILVNSWVILLEVWEDWTRIPRSA